MRAESPLVWVLQGLRPGDNAQARELAARLSALTETKHVRYNWLYRLPNFLLGAGLASVREGAEDLTPPWPDLVIGIGRRSVPVARWIQRKAGGRTRLVHLGRPRARLDLFDLVITTPQYGLPQAPNVIETDIAAGVRAAAGGIRTGVLARGLRRPSETHDRGSGWRTGTAVCDAAIRNGRSHQCRRRSCGKSWAGRWSSSARPGRRKSIFQQAVGALGGPCRHFGWSAGKGNPYRALLHLADRFIVTSDSISMLAEALRTGKPVDVYQLPVRHGARLPLERWPFSLLVRKGYLATRRDVSSFVARLIDNKHVGVLGEENAVRMPVASHDDQVIAPVRALLQK